MIVDVVSVVEAAYDLAGDLRGWLAGLGAAARPLLDDGLGLLAYTVDRRRASEDWLDDPVAIGADAAFAKALVEVHRHRPPAVRVRPYIGATSVHTASEIFAPRGGAALVREAGARAAARFGVADVLRIAAWADPWFGCVLAVPLGRTSRVDRSRARRWSRVAAHVGAALRLRRALSSTDAVLTTDGRIHHASQRLSRTARELLRVAVVERERASARLRRSDPDQVLASWRALVAGRWSLVDRFERDGRRYVVAMADPALANDPRGWTAQECAVAPLVARCASNKLIAAELGIAEGTAAAHVASLRRKTGARARAVLVDRVTPPRDGDVARLSIGGVELRVLGESCQRSAVGLTPAEYEVAFAVADGSSNAEVARRRKTSVSTVVNQLQRIYAKLGIGSRAELAARLRGS